jgi:hypothetical protein
MKKRMGHAHGIDRFLPNRPAGNLVLYCPACPEPGFNIESHQMPPPKWARHLLQSQMTLDGNFQLNRMKKNSDPDDVSLCKGKGHFPEHSQLDEYLKRVSKYREEVC